MLKALIVLLIGYIVFVGVWEIVYKKLNPSYPTYFIAGDKGSGKSTYSAKLAREYMRKGWTVYSTDYIEGCFKLNVDDLANGYKLPPNSLAIIDESSLKFNSRSFKSTSLTIIEYFKMARHHKNACCLISQTFSDTDKQIRDLADNVMFIRKIVDGLLSVPVKVRGKLDVDDSGQPCIKYKIGKFGKPYILPFYYKYFNSYNNSDLPIVERIKW